MVKLLIASAVFFGAWFAWSFLHLPAWTPVTVLGYGLTLRTLISGALACVAWGGQK